MNVFHTLTSNYIVNVGAVSWLLAQVLKTLFTFVNTKKVVLERLIGAGGMPSSHSALTCSIAIAMARKLGFASPEFGLALAFAGIVMYDAMGVRRAAGEQAKVLNRIVFEFPIPFFQSLHQGRNSLENDEDGGEEAAGESAVDQQEAESGSEPLLHKELKEYLGHTPMEVLGGCLLGILVSVFLPVV